MSFSQNHSQGVQITLKFKPYNPNSVKYVGPSQLGYGNKMTLQSNTATNHLSTNISSLSKKNLMFENVAIISKKAQKVLDICQDKGKEGLLIIYEDFNQPNQRFDIIKVGDFVHIASRKNGKYLTVAGNSQKNGAPVFQEPSHNLVGQKFRLALCQNGQYLIHTFSGKVLDCCQERTSNGTPVIQWKCDRKQHQMWLIK